MNCIKLSKQAPDLMTIHTLVDPRMAQAWIDCLRYTISDPKALAAFHSDTGSTFTPGRALIDRMIDEATGRDREFVELYLAWFDENVWGDE